MKIESEGQNLAGDLVMAHSDHWGPVSDPIYLQKQGFGHLS